jgi:hypothetical protein
LVVLASILASSGCNEKLSPSIIPTLTTEVFTGTINPLGSSSHTFTVQYESSRTDAFVVVTSLTAADGGPRSVTFGLALGNTSGGVCTRAPSYTRNVATLNEVIRTDDQPFFRGAYCVMIFDNPAAPTITEPLNYSLTIEHY